jgi:hypothetical protein
VTGPQAVPSPAKLEAPRPHSRGPLIFSSALAIVWCAILIAMAWLTSDPITLNRDQILGADFVITGRVESDPAAGEVTVLREWHKNALSGTIHVENLGDVRVRTGQTYLMPLSHAPTGYRITEARLANSALLVYPATQEAVRQLEQILPERAPEK